MQKRHWYFLVFIFFGLSFIAMDYLAQKKMIMSGHFNFKKPAKVVLQLESQHEQTKNDRSPDSSLAAEESIPSDLNQFKKDFLKEAQKIGQLQNDPEAVEERLQTFARYLESAELKYLASVVRDVQSNGDHRAMAIELLSLNQSDLAMKELAQFATAPLAPGQGIRADEEMVFRAQAIEGIAANTDRNMSYQLLMEVQNKTNSSFLADRAARALAEVRGGASVEQTDAKALKELIK